MIDPSNMLVIIGSNEYGAEIQKQSIKQVLANNTNHNSNATNLNNAVKVN